MSYRLMFIINAVVLALVGVAFMIMPSSILAQFKSDEQVATLFVARFFGGALLLGGLLLWFLKDVAAKTQKNIAFVLLGYSVAGFAMTIVGMSRSFVGVIRENGWILLVIFGLFTLIYGYILFLQPKPAPSKSRSPRKGKSVSPTDGEPYE
jgi:hypothetical protein